MVTRNLLELPTREELRADLVARHRSVLPDWAGRGTSPLFVADDAIAGWLLAQFMEFNVAADRALISTATGVWLDDLAAIFGVTREPGQTDRQVRLAITAAFARVSAGTPEAIRADAFAASEEVADVSMRTDLANNEIDVWLTVMATGSPPSIVPPADVISAVANYLNDDNRRLIVIDRHVVASATVETYTVAGTVTFARDAASPEATSLSNLDSWMMAHRTLNTRISTSALIAALWTPDVIDVDLTSPAADLAAVISTARVGSAGTISFVRET